MRKLLLSFLCLVQVFHAASLHAGSGVNAPPGNAIASAHPLATRAGMELFRQGGNAFDAAIAVTAVLAVVEPYHSGLGGGGFWLLHDETEHSDVFLDGREVAPAKARQDMYLDKDKQVIPQVSVIGPLAAAIPGEPAAIAYLSKHYARLSLAQDLAPAIALAEQGFAVDQQYRDMLLMRESLSAIKRFPASKKIFTHDGHVPEVGSLLVQKNLAKTLRALANLGRKGFYEGKIAQQLVDSVKAGGGIWSLQDLANYRVKLRRPLVANYRDMTVITAPLPSAGGISLITMLNILYPLKLSGRTKLERIHYLLEAMRLAFWDRANYLADPDFVSVPIRRLISFQHAAKLRKFIQADKAMPSKHLPHRMDEVPVKQANTTHFSIIDSQGNRVAATLTINFIFGSGFVAKGTGVLLNDQMDDFSIKVGVENIFGLVGHEKNKIEPGKRPLSSMSPTFLESTDRVAILGTPGGSRIPTMVLLAVLEYAEHRGVIGMVSVLRFHHQYLPDIVAFEPGAFGQRLERQLVDMGYKLKPLSDYYGDMQVVEWNKLSNTLFAASDPRRMGLAVVDNSTQRVGYGVNH